MRRIVLPDGINHRTGRGRDAGPRTASARRLIDARTKHLTAYNGSGVAGVSAAGG